MAQTIDEIENIIRMAELDNRELLKAVARNNHLLADMRKTLRVMKLNAYLRNPFPLSKQHIDVLTMENCDESNPTCRDYSCYTILVFVDPFTVAEQ